MMALRQCALACHRLYPLPSMVRPLNTTQRLVAYSTEPQATPLPVSSSSNNTDRPGLRKQLPQLSSVDEVLTSFRNRQLTVNDASLVLQRITSLCCQDPPLSRDEIQEFLSDERFQRLARFLHNGALKLDVPSLLQALHCMLTMVPEDIYLIQSLEMQVRWLLRRMPISQLAKVIEIHQAHQETELRRQIYQEAMGTVEKRWAEVSTPKDIISLMYLARDKSQSVMGKLEERALDLCQQMTCKQLYRVLYILSQQQRRNTPLLRALVFHLNKQTLELTDVQLSNMLFALARLNMNDVNLLEAISEELIVRSKKNLNLSVIVSCINSLGILRWCDKLLIEVLCSALLSHKQDVTSKQYAGLVRTCASLDYLPVAVERNLPQMTEELSQSLRDDPSAWLDVVWCLMLLKKANNQMIDSILNPEFISTFEALSDADQPVSQLKLLNLLLAAQQEVPDCSNYTLPEHIHNVQIPLKTVRPLHDAVVKALGSSLTLDKYVKTDVFLDTGYLVDMELLVDSRGQPQPLTTPNADTCHKVVLKLLEFGDMTLHDVQPTGFHKMVTRHLQLQGYIVVEIPHQEFLSLGTVVRQVQYIEKQVQQALKQNISQT